ncbi:AGE family epimerase/isomerase [Microbacterium esteraromaticum]|uniref:AGE family epimerase/isomerase n=1 Tax=Microbacterium esteraromaticum TaxID=57043 RepID=UPI0019D3A1FD|nr:AGE family epimerase/isomerase [Microbacterium esteraromaticum]MBN7793886.1 AGE family epimerase/isomerase [Microbacterium esteraromaticum]MCA1307328.1 AGE family epimerase/isomerase [Microbacterium esteraromaticum]
MTPHARTQLENVVLPFWMQEGIDERFGGFHTCFDNRGRERVSDDKYTWSQGRFIWILSRLAQLSERGMLRVDGHDAAQMLRWARQGAEFLYEHVLRPDATCVFVTRRDGAASEGAHPPRSVYADLFAAMGFAEYARVSGERAWLDSARRILDRATVDVRSGVAPTPPYDVPRGHRAFGPHLILLNALNVLTEAERSLTGVSTRDDEVATEIDAVMGFREDSGVFAEMPRVDGVNGSDLVTRHRVPGHALEALWIALEGIELVGGSAADHREPALESINPLCELGWDAEREGLFRYVDRDGGRPRGVCTETPYESLVRETWDTKLWWVHTEAAAVTAVAAQRYGRADCGVWHSRIWGYTLATFPGGDDGREWVQIRNRDGSPRDSVVALPVKDPFHIVRNLVQLLEVDHELALVREVR